MGAPYGNCNACKGRKKTGWYRKSGSRKHLLNVKITGKGLPPHAHTVKMNWSKYYNDVTGRRGIPKRRK